MVYGDGKQIRDFNHVHDVVNAMLLAAESKEANGQIFNLGGDQPIGLEDLVKLMIKIKGSGKYKLVPFPSDKKRIDIGDFCGDYSKIRDTLGWRPKKALVEGLTETIGYYTGHLQHYLH